MVFRTDLICLGDPELFVFTGRVAAMPLPYGLHHLHGYEVIKILILPVGTKCLFND